MSFIGDFIFHNYPGRNGVLHCYSIVLLVGYQSHAFILSHHIIARAHKFIHLFLFWFKSSFPKSPGGNFLKDNQNSTFMSVWNLDVREMRLILIYFLKFWFSRGGSKGNQRKKMWPLGQLPVKENKFLVWLIFSHPLMILSL